MRGAITASPGKNLFVADYASIEARVLLWLAEDDAALDVFRNHKDIYCEMASEIYARPITKADKNERQMGKVAILGLGYQMGAAKFVSTCATYGIEITEDFSKVVVDAYRSKFWTVKSEWEDQEAAAMEAVRNPWRHVDAGRVSWVYDKKFLYCELPSGRRLAYPRAFIQDREMPWGGMKSSLGYYGINSRTFKWDRQFAYGGMLVENITQAVARDIMAEAIERVEASGVYAPLLTVHDELIAEAHPAIGNIDEFVALISQVPEWADGLPVEAEGWSGVRYHK